MWTGSFETQALFKPHIDNCTSSEVFIPMGLSVDLGFCIEKAERSAAEFNVARQTCAALGMRLPETVEWTQACLKAPSGLVDMTGDWKWSSNFTFGISDATAGGNGLHVMVSGYNNCRHSVVGEVFGGTASAYSYAFRCVR